PERNDTALDQEARRKVSGEFPVGADQKRIDGELRDGDPLGPPPGALRLSRFGHASSSALLREAPIPPNDKQFLLWTHASEAVAPAPNRRNKILAPESMDEGFDTAMQSVSRPLVRRWPIGAELQEGGVHFRVWAPRARQVDVVFETTHPETPLNAE